MDDYDRREFLSLSLPGFLGVMMALPSLCTLATRANARDGRLPADGGIHWEAFLEAVAKEAAKQHLDAWNQDDYVQTIGKLARQLHMEDPVLRKGMEQLGARLKQGGVDFHYLEERVDFSLCLVQFDQGQVIKPHDHPGMTGMILCASGEIATSNYDLVEEPGKEAKDGGTCLLRRVGQNVLRKNDLSTLTAKARNIHTLHARKVTQLVDIFTPPYNDERSEQSRWYELAPEARAGSEDLFEAKIT
jgi:PCO_ADO